MERILTPFSDLWPPPGGLKNNQNQRAVRKTLQAWRCSMARTRVKRSASQTRSSHRKRWSADCKRYRGHPPTQPIRDTTAAGATGVALRFGSPPGGPSKSLKKIPWELPQKLPNEAPEVGNFTGAGAPRPSVKNASLFFAQFKTSEKREEH